MNRVDRAIDIRRRECRAVKRPLYTTDATERARRVEEYVDRIARGQKLWPADQDEDPQSQPDEGG